MTRTTGRLAALASLAAVLMATSGSVVAAQAAARPATVYACAKKKSGTVRIVKKSTKCRRSERKLELALAAG